MKTYNMVKYLMILLLFRNCQPANTELIQAILFKFEEKGILEVSEPFSLYVQSDNPKISVPNEVIINNQKITLVKSNSNNFLPHLFLSFSIKENLYKVHFYLRSKGGYRYKGEILLKVIGEIINVKDIKYISEIE